MRGRRVRGEHFPAKAGRGRKRRWVTSCESHYRTTHSTARQLHIRKSPRKDRTFGAQRLDGSGGQIALVREDHRRRRFGTARLGGGVVTVGFRASFAFPVHASQEISQASIIGGGAHVGRIKCISDGLGVEPKDLRRRCGKGGRGNSIGKVTRRGEGGGICTSERQPKSDDESSDLTSFHASILPDGEHLRYPEFPKG